MMHKVILIPDSFKGTMSSMKICDILSDAVRRHFPCCEVVSIPVADGGEGMADCFLKAVGGKRITVTAQNPFGEPIETFYSVLPDQKTAVIETAAVIGLPLVENKKNPLTASTYGVGELIRHAVDRGCNQILLGLGGSSTNDAGTGMAAALGVRFFDCEGTAFVPVGGTLSRVTRIDASNARAYLRNVHVTAMCDVENPLYGETGAAFVFGPQKGADPETVKLLDGNLRALCKTIHTSLGPDLSSLPGGGAAGGLGAGAVAFLGGHLMAGIEAVLDIVRFDALLAGADLVITGEGRIDAQSVRGKVISGVAKRAKRQDTPVVAIVGDIEEGAEQLYESGLTAVFSINKKAVPFSQARLTCENDLAFTADALMRILKATASR